VHWSGVEPIHGLPEGAFGGNFDAYLLDVHPEDRDYVLSSIGRSIADGAPLDMEYRIVRPDGTTVWVEGKGHPVRGDDGRVIQVSGVCMDITRRKLLELERADLLERERTAREDAEEANRQKDNFLALLGHELRQPLGAMLAATHVLQHAAAVEARERAQAVLTRQVHHLQRLIDDLSDAARIERGRIDLRADIVDLRTVVDDAIVTLRAQIDARQHALTAHAPDSAVLVHGDADRLRQVVSNLLDNAVKYTEPGGRIDIGVAHGTSGAHLSVCDTGRGIAREALPHVFDLFMQERPGSGNGLGIGLSVVRGLVVLHGGRIEADSDGPGRGSRFQVFLPLAQPSTSPAPPA
jgi:two-component system CheB/CheR fusion protein